MRTYGKHMISSDGFGLGKKKTVAEIKRDLQCEQKKKLALRGLEQVWAPTHSLNQAYHGQYLGD